VSNDFKPKELKMKVRTQAAMVAVLMAMAVPAFAQQPPPPPQPPHPPQFGQRADSIRPRMLNVEAALRFKQELKLSEAQVSQLEAVRKEIVADRQAEARDRFDIESRLMAGLISEDEVRKQFDSKRDALRQTMQQRRDRLAKILSEEQQEQLQRETHRRMMDRMHDRGDRRGPGMRGRGRMGFGRMPFWRDGF
jgi:Spy/CpxP family protein refolding chaperone